MLKINQPTLFNKIPDGILFDTDNTLYPYDPAHLKAMCALKLKISNTLNVSEKDVEKNFNQEILQVIGLEDGDYAFFIQDKLITTYSAEQLNKGVNLSTESNTPQYKQAQEIMALCEEYRKTG